MPHRFDEKQLVQLCLQNDRSAQHLLFERYGRKMMSVCMRYARHQQEAEDMLQDGFVRVFKYLHSYSFDGPLEAWIRRVIVNASLRTVKRASFTNEKIGLPEYYDEKVDSTAIAQLGEEELLKIINGLPDGYRYVFNMYVIEGYSHKEIAEKLGCGESTSRSQLAKAKRMLRDMITENEKIAV